MPTGHEMFKDVDAVARAPLEIERGSALGHGHMHEGAASSSGRASFKPLDISEFISSGLVVSQVSMSHTVDKGTLTDSSAVWYRKEFSNPATARREWLAQEFLRLITPNQTETRLAYNPVSNVYYVLSKEVPGFKPLPTHEQEKFSNGTYKGLGHIIIGAYFVHEADLKNGNIGLGDDNTVYKIDGDWSFASMRSDMQFPKISGAIAAVQINRLPFPMTYKAHNWLDIFIEGSLASKSDIVSSDIVSSPQFEQEKFETLFKLSLIPDKYFQKFVDAFIPAGAKEYSDFLIDRQKTLLKQASRIHGFSEYLTTNNSKLAEMADTFQKQMMEFVVQGKYTVLNDVERSSMINHMKAQFNQVLVTFNLPLDAPMSAPPIGRPPMSASSAASGASSGASAGAGVSHSSSDEEVETSVSLGPKEGEHLMVPSKSSAHGFFARKSFEDAKESKTEALNNKGPGVNR